MITKTNQTWAYSRESRGAKAEINNQMPFATKWKARQGKNRSSFVRQRCPTAANCSQAPARLNRNRTRRYGTPGARTFATFRAADVREPGRPSSRMAGRVVVGVLPLDLPPVLLFRSPPEHRESWQILVDQRKDFRLHPLACPPQSTHARKVHSVKGFRTLDARPSPGMMFH